MVLLDSARKYFSVVTHVVQKFCRACRSTAVCTMGIYIVWNYRTDNRLKILFLFNLFFFLTSFT